ncbi:KUP/HAK/KT family potassium transporter [Nocardia tengchongensis]|uniref:KUP/HAK/KT family potassium transporter n=1 Tax=Nocardia tengchongensis TaxID=2055889 RepID=UPI0036B9A6EB
MLPLLIGPAAFLIMTTWQRWRTVVADERVRLAGSLREFVDEPWHDPSRLTIVEGTAVFLNRGKDTVPLALRANVEHNGVRHRQTVIVSVDAEAVPRIAPDDRVRIDHLGYRDDGIVHVTVRVGYIEPPTSPPPWPPSIPTRPRVNSTWPAPIARKPQPRRGFQKSYRPRRCCSRSTVTAGSWLSSSSSTAATPT